MEFMKIRKKDIKGNMKLKVKKGALPACMDCLPPVAMDGHLTLHGVMVHTRIDCPEDTVYLVENISFKK